MDIIPPPELPPASLAASSPHDVGVKRRRLNDERNDPEKDSDHEDHNQEPEELNDRDYYDSDCHCSECERERERNGSDDDEEDDEEEEEEDDDDDDDSECQSVGDFIISQMLRAAMPDMSDDEESCDCEDCMRNRQMSMFRFALESGIYRPDESDEEDDDEEDDDDNDEDEDGTEDDDSGLLESSRANDKDDASHSDKKEVQDCHENIEPHEVTDDEEDDDEQQCCAVCFNSRSLITLPCCGTDGREEQSSTRFCNDCLVKTLDLQTPRLLVGPCPRCRQLLAYRYKEDEVEVASVYQAIIYAERQGDKSHHSILLGMGFGNHNFLPVEMLDDDREKVRQMVTWNLLNTTKRSDVFCMTLENQLILRNQLEQVFQVMNEDQGDEPDEICKGWILVAGKMLIAAVDVLFEFKVLILLRLLHEASVAFLRSWGFLPLDHLSRRTEALVMLMNAFLGMWITMALGILLSCFVVCYTCIETVSWMLGMPRPKTRRTLFRASLGLIMTSLSFVGFLSCFGWRFMWRLGLGGEAEL